MASNFEKKREKMEEPNPFFHVVCMALVSIIDKSNGKILHSTENENRQERMHDLFKNFQKIYKLSIPASRSKKS